jgi:hypothetical protein
LLSVPSYNVEITPHQSNKSNNQTVQIIEKGWFNILDLLRFCDKRDMARGLWLARYGFESLDGKVKMIRDKWTI